MRLFERMDDWIAQPNPLEWIRAREHEIEDRAGAHSKALSAPHSQVLSVADLRLLFQLYDETFFQSAISSELRRAKAGLGFRLGNRLTSAGAVTKRFRRRSETRYEIAFSTTLLAESFATPGEVHWVAGRLCENRFQALARLMEHELIHLIELLAFGKSSCGAKRFKSLAANLFRHECSHHRLMRPVDRLRLDTGLRVGDHVCFEHAGQKLRGRINRITKRATILVPDSHGPRYSDGQRYQKYLVPFDRLSSAPH